MRIFIFIFAALSAAPAPAAEKLNSVVAIVNNQSISRLEIESHAERMRAIAAARGENPTDNEIRGQVLNALVSRMLQIQESRRLGGKMPDAALKQRFADLLAEWGVSEENARAAVLERTGLKLEDFLEKLREDMQIEALFYREVYSKIDVSEQEIEDFLRTDLTGAREYRLRHILIDGENAEKRAEEIRLRAENGESFADLAKQYSAGENAADGGDLQWRTAGRLPASFVAAAENLTPGDVSGVIATGRGFHLLQLAEARGGVFDPEAKRMRLAHIFLEPGANDTADLVLERIKNGADFGELAAQYSTDKRSAGKGGDLGWFFPGNLPEYFVPVKTLASGEVSAPIKSPFGLHIVLVSALEKTDIQTVRKRAREALRERRARAQRPDWLRRLRNRAYVVVIDPEFGKFLDGGQ